MSWNAANLPEKRTALDVKTLAAYNRGEPLPRLAKPRYEGPSSPESTYFYNSLGYSRGRIVPDGFRYFWSVSTVIRGRETTEPANVVKALWGDHVWVEGRGWISYWDIVKRGYVEEDLYGCRI